MLVKTLQSVISRRRASNEHENNAIPLHTIDARYFQSYLFKSFFGVEMCLPKSSQLFNEYVKSKKSVASALLTCVEIAN